MPCKFASRISRFPFVIEITLEIQEVLLEVQPEMAEIRDAERGANEVRHEGQVSFWR